MITGIGLGVLALALLMLWVRVWRSWQHTPTYFDAQYKTQTLDGWTLGSFRYVPTGPEQGAKAVVILCHDVGSSPQLWEQEGSDSWPLQLKAMGYDVWSVGLRGTGPSRPQYLDAFHGWGWDIETHLDLDIPALFETIKHQANDLPIHWIGHGLGGVLGLLAQAQHQLPLASVTVMGAGLQALRKFGLVWRLARLWPRPVFPLRWCYRLLSPPLLLWEHLRDVIQRVLLRRPHTLSRRMFASLSTHLTPVSTSLLQQWLQWIARGQWLSSAGKHRLHKSLSKIACPVLCLSLPGDTLAPHTAVRRLYQQLPEARRSLYDIQASRQEVPPVASHFAPLLETPLRHHLIAYVHEWHQSFAPFPVEKKRRKRRKKRGKQEAMPESKA